MKTDLKPMTDYLIGLGINDIEHTEKSYLAHLVAVCRGLDRWNCAEHVCLAGLFHSIYGTELFQGFTLSFEKRNEVSALIGERAERLAWINCVLDRTLFDKSHTQATGPWRMRNRINGDDIVMEEDEFNELCVIHLWDWLEQVERWNNWDYRRTGYRFLAERLGGFYLEQYDAVFVREPKANVK